MYWLLCVKCFFTSFAQIFYSIRQTKHYNMHVYICEYHSFGLKFKCECYAITVSNDLFMEFWLCVIHPQNSELEQFWHNERAKRRNKWNSIHTMCPWAQHSYIYAVVQYKAKFTCNGMPSLYRCTVYIVQVADSHRIGLHCIALQLLMFRVPFLVLFKFNYLDDSRCIYLFYFLFFCSLRVAFTFSVNEELNAAVF